MRKVDDALAVNATTEVVQRRGFSPVVLGRFAGRVEKSLITPSSTTVCNGKGFPKMRARFWRCAQRLPWPRRSSLSRRP